MDFGKYVETLVTYLVRSYSKMGVRLQIEVETVFLDIDTAVPCGLILNELISNALKYAFPNGRSGQIAIALKQEGENQAQLHVADNGVGLPLGFDSANSNTLGFQLIYALVSQLAGQIYIDQSEGLQFIITIPLHKKQGASV